MAWGDQLNQKDVYSSTPQLHLTAVPFHMVQKPSATKFTTKSEEPPYSIWAAGVSFTHVTKVMWLTVYMYMYKRSWQYYG